MRHHRRIRKSDAPPGLEDPVSRAVTGQQAGALAMVEEAVATRQVALAYQPVIQAVRPDRVAFHEGLMRIYDPAGRVVPARDFIGAVETAQTGRDIDVLALEMGLATLQAQPDLRLSVNMSARSIGYPPWLRRLRRGLARDATIGERLILEITETSAMLVPELVIRFMRDVARHGVCFALDDFGAGYTSFRHFRDFQFDLVKIDGQFVRGVTQNPDNQVLIRALAMIAEQFDIFTVAEGVERAEDAEWLISNGIDCLQGYYFAAPTVHPPWDEAETLRGYA